MPPDAPLPTPRPTASAVVRRHLLLVTAFVVLGALAGWFYSTSTPTTYSSTARVLVNPSVGNPFAPSASAVRQDELTSMETEAQVARSTEVLRAVAADHPPLTVRSLQKNLQVVVPPNTQILEISWTGTDGAVAQQVTDAVATAYLDNRTRRFDQTNNDRIDQVSTQTTRVVTDLETATSASHHGTPAERSFQAELATALRNELVSLRAQRTSLETSTAPAGSVIAPASAATGSRSRTSLAAPVLGALAGLVLGYLVALLRERLGRTVVGVGEVESSGLLVAAVPRPGWSGRLLHHDNAAAVESTIRRLRASILDADPRPSSIAVAAPASGTLDAVAVSEALATSIARSGHAAALVRTTSSTAANGLVRDDGLTELLLHERLNVQDLLHSTVEPLLCVLPSGAATSHLADLLLTDRIRPVLTTLADEGNLVVVQAPGLDTPEGEAVIRAASVVVVVVTLGRTRRAALEQAARSARAAGLPAVGLVLGRHDAVVRPSGIGDGSATYGRSRRLARGWAHARR